MNEQEYAAKVCREIEEKNRGPLREGLHKFFQEPEIVTLTKGTLTAMVFVFAAGSILGNKIWVIPTWITLIILLSYHYWLVKNHS